MIVELDVFSGRPNPRWTVDEETAARLRALVARIDVTVPGPAIAHRLGFRGFVLHLPDGPREVRHSVLPALDALLAELAIGAGYAALLPR